jgi:hypothetical protein
MKPKDDPTIARIRETRHGISEWFGHDPQKLVAYYIELQKKYQDRILDDAAPGQSGPSEDSNESGQQIFCGTQHTPSVMRTVMRSWRAKTAVYVSNRDGFVQVSGHYPA